VYKCLLPRTRFLKVGFDLFFLYKLILSRIFLAALLNPPLRLAAYWLLLSLIKSLIGTPTKPNSFEIEFLKNASKFRSKSALRLQKTKNVGGRVRIYIRYLSFRYLPFPSWGILCTFANSIIHLLRSPVDTLEFHFS